MRDIRSRTTNQATLDIVRGEVSRERSSPRYLKGGLRRNHDTCLNKMKGRLRTPTRSGNTTVLIHCATEKVRERSKEVGMDGSAESLPTAHKRTSRTRVHNGPDSNSTSRSLLNQYPRNQSVSPRTLASLNLMPFKHSDQSRNGWTRTRSCRLGSACRSLRWRNFVLS